MRLNALGRASMNNPFRARLQSGYIASLLRRFGGAGSVRRALEVGCGRGGGARPARPDVRRGLMAALTYLVGDVIGVARRRVTA